MPTVSGPAMPPYPGGQPPYPGGQPPYPGGQPPVWPAAAAPGPTPLWPAAPPTAPPARPRRRRGWIIGIAAAVVIGLAAGATTAVLLLNKPESPTTMALRSGQALAGAAGLALAGSIDGAAANVTVTRAGTVEGSYTQDGSRISRVTIGGVSYLKAPASFWAVEADQEAAKQAGGHWAKAPADLGLMSFAALLPGQISRVLEHVGEHPRVTDGTSGGQKVIRLSAQGATYTITTGTPNRLVHVDGTSGTARYSFDLTPLTAAAIGPVFTALHDDVQGMQGAAEPGATVNALQKIQFHHDCDGNSSCTVSIKVSVSDSDSPVVLLTLRVAFSGTENGHSFATCTATVRAATAHSAVTTPSCRLGNPVWPRWVNSHASDFNTWAAPTFTVTVNTASDIAALQSKLNAEQGT
jgi:hypothetical protein